MPPLTEAIHISAPLAANSSCSQRNPSGGSGDPVVATHCTLDRSKSLAGCTPAL